ncbi:hypothetical protein GYMLUDRAFT_253042 [Collybiopsis luxurians FD-317 M1]|uniref:Uncharacterized protein n=1 Tax=Collybiopsis luxurians FD-317 M1 TaxID=944289 RepID=A0A0D0BY79_9AGAR|nr:hypothetical protein GYMLUDRAFT_253042 [Collybiopsis luxurians FD-317 M1]
MTSTYKIDTGWVQQNTGVHTKSIEFQWLEAGCAEPRPLHWCSPKFDHGVHHRFKPHVVIYAAPVFSSKLASEPLEGIDTDTWDEEGLVEVHDKEVKVTKNVQGKEANLEPRYISFFELAKTALNLEKGLVELASAKGQRLAFVHRQVLTGKSESNTRVPLFQQPSPQRTILLAESNLTRSLDEPNDIGLFIIAELLPTLHKAFPDTPMVKYIIYVREPKKEWIRSGD